MSAPEFRSFAMFVSRLAAAFGLVLSTLCLQPAQAWELPGSKDHCDTGWVLSYLKAKVDGKFRKYNDNKLFLIDIINPTLVHEVERDDEHRVGRQFCQAKVRMSNGQKRDMWYLLETPWGLAGTPPLAGVEFCIAGLDPWKTYGKDCSTIRQTIGWQTNP
jgi:hypothetical protein